MKWFKKQKNPMKNIEEIKYYALEDLHVGMRVSLSELDKILNVSIYLKSETMDYSTGDPEGEIAAIGKRPDTGQYVHILNTYDITLETESYDVSDFGE